MQKFLLRLSLIFVNNKKAIRKDGFFVCNLLAAGTFYTERLTVCALDYSRMCLMGTDFDAVERTVVFISAVMHTLLYSTANGFVCFTLRDNQKPPLQIAILVWAVYQILCWQFLME